MYSCNESAKGAAKNRGFRGSARLHLKEQITGIPGTAGVAGHRKMVHNRKANCYTLLAFAWQACDNLHCQGVGCML